MISPQELIERILAKSDHADCMVVVEDSTQANLRWANSTLTTNGMIAERKVTVIAFVAVDGGLAVGAATRADIGLDDIDGVLREAGAAAAASGLADDYMPLAGSESIGDWQAAHTATGPEVFGAVAPALGDMFQRSVADSIELFGYAEHTSTSTWLGSKGGLRLRHDQPAGRVEMTGKSHGRTRSTWEGRATRDFSNIDIAEVDAAIRTKLAWQGNRIEVPAGRYDTVLTPSAAADLMVYGMFVADARSAHEGRSAYAKQGGGTRIGERVSKLPVNLYTDPAFAGLECGPFALTTESSALQSVFDNGQRLGRSHMLRGGVLESLFHTRATAKEFGEAFTSIGDNFVMDVDGGIGDTMALVSGVEDGLLLNTMWYIRMVDPATLLLTGLTRDGVYRVRGGEVVGAVNNFRWNESPLEVLGRLTAAGASGITQPREWADWVERVAMPPLRVADFNMSTVSAAN